MIRGTRRPGGAGRTRGGSSTDQGDSLGPGDTLLGGCGSFLNALFWIFVVVAICTVIGVLL